MGLIEQIEVDYDKLAEKWSVVYEKAIKDDGSLYFPSRLNHEFLEDAKRKMGSVLFANQYLNEIFPAEDAKFKKEWFRFYEHLPQGELYNFAHIDPAISTEDGADYTGVVVVSVDSSRNWYVRLAKRQRLSPTAIVDTVFEIHRQFNCLAIGVESVAYQKALIYLLHEQMSSRGVIPVKEIKRGPESNKEIRILGIAPFLEWGKLYMRPEMSDLQKEMLQFPKSAHDDIIDALSSIKEFVFYPTLQGGHHEPVPGSPEWERNHIHQLIQRANERAEFGSESDF